MSVYQLKTFGDIVNAICEECGISSSDTTDRNRVRRAVNIIYQNISGRKNWYWLNQKCELTLPAYVNAGTASVTQNSATVTLSIAPGPSKKGYWFATDGFNEIYRIESHAAGSTTAKLSGIYTGTTNTAATYKIWSERLPLPTDCKETVSVWHDNYRKMLDGVGRQEFRRIWTLQPRNEGYPQFYSTGDYTDPAQTSSITSLPAVSTRASAGTRKTLVFSNSLPASISAAITAGDPVVWNISGAGHPSYNGNVYISAVSTTSASNDTVTYTGPSEYQESSTADAAIAVTQLDPAQDYDRYRELFVYPSLNSVNITLHCEYTRQVVPLNNDADEPYIPIQDRDVLYYGGLWKTWKRKRNKEEADSSGQEYLDKLREMESKFQDSTENARLEPSKMYLGAKRNLMRKRAIDSDWGSLGAGGGSSGQTVTGTPNSAATFDASGVLVGSSTVSTTELGMLDGASSNIQTQLDAKALASDLTAHINDTTAAHAASAISNSPSGNLAATNVQTALDELQSDVDGRALSSHTHAAGDITSGTLAVARGGTNSGATLNNNRVMQSTGGTIAEAAAITASRALISDANGIPTHSAVTSTTLAFLDATSSVQTQLDAKVAKSTLTTKGDTYVATGAGVVVRQAIGSNNDVLIADSAQTNGLKWGTIASAGGLSNPMTTGGDIIYGGASGVPTRLANGSSGQVLVSAGTTNAPTWSGTASALTTLSAAAGVAVHGTNTNDNAAAGYVGEYIESKSSAANSFPATGTLGDATSISLTAGDWDVTMMTAAIPGPATTFTYHNCGISTTSGNSGTGLNQGENWSGTLANAVTNSSMIGATVSNYRMSLSATTTVYGKVQAGFTGTAPTYGYRLSARRVR
jgi:hypothetical protein